MVVDVRIYVDADENETFQVRYANAEGHVFDWQNVDIVWHEDDDYED